MPVVHEQRVFQSRYGYQVNIPDDFVVHDQIPELVVIEKNTSRLRINSGCFDSGVEDMQVVETTTSLNGVPALKQEYYSDANLKLQKYSMEYGSECYSLELSANDMQGWEELIELVKSFRFTR